MGEELLDHHHLGVELLDHFYYTIVQTANADSHVSCARPFSGADDAGLAHVRAARPGLDDGVAGDAQAGIDAEDARLGGPRRGGRGRGRGRLAHAPRVTSWRNGARSIGFAVGRGPVIPFAPAG